MKVKSFILNPVEIKRIMAAQGVPDYRAPPPLVVNNQPSLTLELH